MIALSGNKELHMSFKWFFLCLAFLTGCSTSANITRHNAPEISAKIVGGDGENIYVESPTGRQPIRRSDIADVDHPGDAAAVIGGVLTGYGAVNIVMGAPKCESEGAAFCTGVFAPAAIGIPLMLWGTIVKMNSVSAMNEGADPGRSARVLVLPTHQFAGQPKTPGVSVVGTF
ncbi:hypothetical protein [Polyangium aurulentum]|uniref:hypothetical protein n=1 Tax=Polyangium aurulentum TaxID=2567896 RepID=UPI0010AE8D42|nr:hypothetical protein [Polyangium aurulentum]UQA62787.1 hypothetical protein E8A73_020985 [Polyangium aurulentum]